MGREGVAPAPALAPALALPLGPYPNLPPNPNPKLRKSPFPGKVPAPFLGISLITGNYLDYLKLPELPGMANADSFPPRPNYYCQR